MNQTDFINKLAEEIPEVRKLKEEHLKDFDEILPTILMGAIRRLYCDSIRGKISPDNGIFLEISRHVEYGLELDNEFIRDLIMLGFVENFLGEPDLDLLRSGLGSLTSKALDAMLNH